MSARSQPASSVAARPTSSSITPINRVRSAPRAPVTAVARIVSHACSGKQAAQGEIGDRKNVVRLASAFRERNGHRQSFSVCWRSVVIPLIRPTDGHLAEHCGLNDENTVASAIKREAALHSFVPL